MICLKVWKTATSRCMLMTLSLRLQSIHDIIEKVIPDLMKICDWLKANKLSLNVEFILTGTSHNMLRFGNQLQYESMIIQSKEYTKLNTLV